MTPQVNVNGRNTAAETQARSFVTAEPAPTAQTPYTETATPRDLTYAERQGLAMSWVGIALGTFLLIGGLALWAAAVFNAGFGGWLLAVAVMGILMAVTIVAVGYFFVRPSRKR